MKKLFVLAAFVLLGALAYGQDLDTLVNVGSGGHTFGGDSKKDAYDKINLLFDRVNEIDVREVIVTLDSAELCGAAAGAVGHSAGAVLVAAPGVGYALEFISAVIVWDYSTAAYTGGSDDAVIRIGTVAQTDTILDNRYLKATADLITLVPVKAVATLALTANSTINLKGTTFTDPGTAQGKARIHVRYRRLTTGL